MEPAPPDPTSVDSTPATPVDDVVLVGRIGAPHGIRGWLHLTSYTDPPENLQTMGPLLLRAPGGRGHAPGWQAAGKVKMKQTGSPAKPRLLVLLPGVDTRTDAEAQRGLELGLRADDLPTTDDDSFYWRDLCGLQAIDPEGAVLGRVHAVLSTPAHDVLDIRVEPQLAQALGLESPGQVLVPFVSEFTDAIDLPMKTIVINWPEVFSPGSR